MGKQKAITMQDRKILAERWANGENATVIAVDLGFSAAAIYAELKRGSDGTLDANKRMRYDPDLGQTVYMSNLKNRGRRPAVHAEAGGN